MVENVADKPYSTDLVVSPGISELTGRLHEIVMQIAPEEDGYLKASGKVGKKDTRVSISIYVVSVSDDHPNPYIHMGGTIGNKSGSIKTCEIKGGWGLTVSGALFTDFGQKMSDGDFGSLAQTNDGKPVFEYCGNRVDQLISKVKKGIRDGTVNVEQ